MSEKARLWPFLVAGTTLVLIGAAVYQVGEIVGVVFIMFGLMGLLYVVQSKLHAIL